MVDYNVLEFYTEKLNITNYLNLVNSEDIKLNLNFRTNLEQSFDSDGTYYFKVYYDIVAEGQPISLNWVAVAKLEFIELPVKISSNDILNDERVIELLDESLNQFSSNLNGNLPTINKILEKIL